LESNRSSHYQRDLFGEGEQLWENLQHEIRHQVISLLSQAFIQAIQQVSLANKKEKKDASENQATAFREDSVPLPSAIHAATVDRP
jgi:hypothetical protein